MLVFNNNFYDKINEIINKQVNGYIKKIFNERISFLPKRFEIEITFKQLIHSFKLKK